MHTQQGNSRLQIGRNETNTYLSNTLVRMSERIHSDARAEIKVFPVLRVPHIRALPVRQHERRAGVHRQQVRVRLIEQRLRRLRDRRSVLGVRRGGVAGAGGFREGLLGRAAIGSSVWENAENVPWEN